MTNAYIAGETRKALAEASRARRELSKARVEYLGNKQDGRKNYVGNFGAMVLNRSIDNFDDALFLLDARRYPAACAIARGLIETIAFGYYTLNAIRDELTANGGKAANDLAIKHTNSSFIKSKEQVALKKGVFTLDDYQFTKEAQQRMLEEAAATVRVSKALSFMFKDEQKQKGQKESTVELMYDALCEWTHPSQTSLFTYYAEGGETTPTSVGPIHVKQTAKFQCVMGLKVIQWLPALQRDFETLAVEVMAAGG